MKNKNTGSGRVHRDRLLLYDASAGWLLYAHCAMQKQAPPCVKRGCTISTAKNKIKIKSGDHLHILLHGFAPFNALNFVAGQKQERKRRGEKTAAVYQWMKPPLDWDCALHKRDTCRP